MPPTDDSEALYPPFLAAPPEPLSLPAYFLAFVRNPLGATPAIIYRDTIFQYRGRLTYVTDPQLVKRILLDEFNDFPKTIVERYVFTRLLGKGILTSHGAEWRWQRQAAAPLFRHAEIERYAPVMTEAAERAIAAWRRLPAGGERLVDQDTTRAAFSVIAETMLHSNDPAVTAALERANRDYMLPLSWPGVYGVLGLPEWLPYPAQIRAPRRRARHARPPSEISCASGARNPTLAVDLMTRLLTRQRPRTAARPMARRADRRQSADVPAGRSRDVGQVAGLDALSRRAVPAMGGAHARARSRGCR